MVAPAILSKLMTSSEMDDCLDTLHTEMGEAVSDMCANFDRELGKILMYYIYSHVYIRGRYLIRVVMEEMSP